MSHAKQPSPREADVPSDLDSDSLASMTGAETGASVMSEADRLRAEALEAKDRALRAQAELENVRKRMRREMEDERRYALLPLLRDLLPVVDNMGRAIEATSTSAADASGLLAGVKILAQQLETTFSQYHCHRITALGEPFDPHRHAAISQQPSNEYPAGVVMLVAQDGYQLHDRVIRPAQVIVSTGPAPTKT